MSTNFFSSMSVIIQPLAKGLKSIVLNPIDGGQFP